MRTRMFLLFLILLTVGCSYKRVVVHVHYTGFHPLPIDGRCDVELTKE